MTEGTEVQKAQGGQAGFEPSPTWCHFTATLFVQQEGGCQVWKDILEVLRERPEENSKR